MSKVQQFVSIPESRLATTVTTTASYQYFTVGDVSQALYMVALSNGAGGTTFYTLEQSPGADGPWQELVAETSIAASTAVFETGTLHGVRLRIGVKQNSASADVTITAVCK